MPELDFFEHLANRRFPVTWWIRRPDQIDYISGPDMFRGLFDPSCCSIRCSPTTWPSGRGGVKACPWRQCASAGQPDAAVLVHRRVWPDPPAWRTAHLRLGHRFLQGESIHCLESAAPNRIGFDMKRIMQTRYRIDTYQKPIS